jgi:hypothetical protein
MFSIATASRGAEQHLVALSADALFHIRRSAAGDWSRWSKLFSVRLSRGRGGPAVNITSDGFLRAFVLDQEQLLWEMTCEADECGREQDGVFVSMIGGAVGPVAATAFGVNQIAMLATRALSDGSQRLWHRRWHY